MKLNLKKDWWLANSIFWIISGLFIVIVRALDGSLSAGLLSGGLNIIVGIALLQRSKIVFWITLVMAIFTFFGQISSLSQLSKETGSFSFTLPFGIALVMLVLALMLWQQVRKDGKQAKV